MCLRHLVSNAEILCSSSAFFDQVLLEYKSIGILKELKSCTFREVDRVLFFPDWQEVLEAGACQAKS